MQLKINGLDANIVTVADARWHWRAVLRERFTEVWLDTSGDGPSLAMLVNGQRAWLMYLRHKDGDTGFSSRNPNYNGPPRAVMEF